MLSLMVMRLRWNLPATAPCKQPTLYPIWPPNRQCDLTATCGAALVLQARSLLPAGFFRNMAVPTSTALVVWLEQGN
jgi:hypothetical protein